jgi:hypothetical protein
MAIFQQLRGLAEVFAFIAVENEADDMTRVVDARFRNRREIEVVTLCIGPVHLIQPLSILRDAKDSCSVSALAIYHAQVSGFRDQGTEIWARENTN